VETLVINVPDEKSTVVKLILKELGVTIQNKAIAKKLAEEVNKNIKPGIKPDMDEIIYEVKQVRSGR
jgi:phosphoribosyl-ATP pyrophosphohydrolase